MVATPKPVPADQLYSHWSQVPAANWRWPDFSPQEIACRSDGSVRVNAAAMDKLQHLRTKLGRPLILNSAYRTPEYNKKVGGAKSSQHLLAKAFDVTQTNQNPAEFLKAAHEVGFTGFGQYPKQNFIHIDIGPARTWNDGSNFPNKEELKDVATPDFSTPPVTATVRNSVLTKENATVIGTAAAGIGIGPVLADSSNPITWVVAGIVVVVAAVWLAVWLRRNRHPKLND